MIRISNIFVFCTCQFNSSPLLGFCAINRSLYGRGLCFVLPFRSVVPPSAFGHHATRPLTSVRRCYFCFLTFLVAPLRYAFFKVKKTNRTLFFQRWLFLHSLRSLERLRLILLLFSRYFATSRQAWLL